MVEMAVKKLNSGNAPGPSDITAETIKAAGAVGVNHLHSLTNKIIPPHGFAVHRTEEDPNSWGQSDPAKGTQLQRFDPAQLQTRWLGWMIG